MAGTTAVAAVGGWAGAASEASRVLVDRFWDGRRGLHRIRSSTPLRRWGTWHYWWQAHALDATVDAYERAPGPDAGVRVAAQVGAVPRRNGSPLRDFFDDMAWLGLALVHVTEAGVPGGPDAPVEPTVDLLLRELRAGESPVCGGGVAWARHALDFKNVPATAPTAILAARWGSRTGDRDLVAWAAGLVDWMHRTVVEDGVVWDGVRPGPDGTLRLERAEYTYGYGVVVGADLAVGTATRRPGLLERAAATAAVALERMADPGTGCWRDEGGGDGGLFKGILARHLGDLALARRDRALAAALGRQGEAVTAAMAGGSGLVGSDWSRPPPGDVDLSEHLSGVLLLEQCARLERADLLRRTPPE